MADVLDWQSAPDPRAAVRQVVAALRAGRVVAFPTETSYALAASGLAPEAVARAGEAAAAGAPLPLAVRGLAEARDWVPGLGALGQRLARRFWPGPLTLGVQAAADQGLAARLPEAVRRAVCPEGSLRLRAPAHEAILEVLRQLPGPLVLAPVRVGDEGAEAPDAEQALRAAGGRVDLVLDDGPCHYRQPATVVQVNGSSWTVVRPGVVSEQRLREQSGCVVVFVCTGNTCRSPLAEALFKKRLADALGCAAEELPARGFFVLSAGLAAMMGGGAAPEAVEVARRYGADLSGHHSQPLSGDLAAQADYLIVMTRGHRSALLDRYPRLGARPRLLRPDGADLPDPIGQATPVYEECGEQIWRCLEPLLAEAVG
jgi:tRNA threonylcarbamoyl adenosine modification protein (Sua5/YciO/YrdC/YwlC family)